MDLITLLYVLNITEPIVEAQVPSHIVVMSNTSKGRYFGKELIIIKVFFFRVKPRKILVFAKN